jgi:hypothetical protein
MMGLGRLGENRAEKLLSCTGWTLALFLSGLFVAMHSWDHVCFLFNFDRQVLPWIFGVVQGLTGLWIACRICEFISRISTVIAIFTLLTLITAFALIFPPLNRGDIYHGGSDRDEGLNVATSALLKGHYPYTSTGIVEASGSLVGPGGNPISPLPGELILAAPFVALTGEGAWHNFFWLGLFWLSIALFSGNGKSFDAGAATGALLLLLSSPTITGGEIMTGGDLLAISLALLISCAWVQRAERKSFIFISSILCGLAIATRPHFFMVLPLLFASLLYRRITYPLYRIITVIVVSCGVTLLFWALNPSGFSPLHAGRMVLKFSDVLAHPDRWLYGGLLATVILLAYCIARGCMRLETAAGILFLLPSVFFTVLASIQSGNLEWGYAFYGLTGWVFLIFAAWSIAIRMKTGRLNV